MISIKDESQIKLMRKSADILVEIMKEMKEEIKPGVRTKEFEEIANRTTQEKGVSCSFKGVHDYPACTCTSINEEIVHVPPSERKLQKGDLFSLDMGVSFENYHSDMAFTVPIGNVDKKALKLMKTTRKALLESIKKVKRDVSVRLGKASDKEDEVKYIWQQASNATAEGYSSVVLLPNHDDILDFANRLLERESKPKWNLVENNWGKPNYNSLNKHFKNIDLKVEYIGNGYGSFQNAERNRNLILMTYHSAKGMDFENVFLPYLSDDNYIKDETLLMVALTRSKMNLYITYSGYLHHLVERFKSTCQRIDLNTVNNESKNIDDDFDF